METTSPSSREEQSKKTAAVVKMEPLDVAADGSSREMAGGSEKRGGKKVFAAAGGGGGGSSSMRICQADKCTADLSDAKQYHRRHKVCEVHAKSQAVMVAGKPQRFCQQCSRFHELSEFDEAKRSCRRRLAGHNERRRKNTSESSEGNPSNRVKGSVAGTHMKELACGQVDERGRIQITIKGNSSYKNFQIR